jgi:hypothetical protein
VETTEYQDHDSLVCRAGIVSHGSDAADLPHYSFAPRFEPAWTATIRTHNPGKAP